MLTIRELGLLTRDLVSLWARFFPLLGGWFALGYGIRFAAMQLAVIVGTERVIVGNLIFVLGLVAWILCLVLMIAALGPGLRFDRAGNLPEELRGLYSVHSRQEVLLHGAAPFVALYAVGGFAEEQVDALQAAALAILNMDYHRFQLVRFDQWHVFAIMAGVAWLIQLGSGLVHRRWPTLVTGVLQVGAKATVVLSAFIVVTELGRRLANWLSTRAFVGWLADAWSAFLGWLPQWRFFSWELPEAVKAAGEFVIGTMVPGAVTVVVIPLAWLALTASVFGWRALERNLIGTSAAERALLDGADRVLKSRAAQRVIDAAADGPLQAAVRLVRHIGADYLPVAQGVRLIARAGARFVAAYLVVYAVVALTQRVAEWGAWELAAALPTDLQVAGQVLMIVVGLVFTTLAVALYAQGFDRAMLAAARGPGQDPDGPRQNPDSSAIAFAGNPGTVSTT